MATDGENEWQECSEQCTQPDSNQSQPRCNQRVLRILQALLKTIPELRPVHRKMQRGPDNMYSFQVEWSFLFSFVIKTKLINRLNPHTNTRAHAQSHAHSCGTQTHALTHAHSSLTHKHRRFRCSCSLRIVFLSNGTAVLQRKYTTQEER